jgi:multidrug efflux pump subunit AcrB
MNERKHLKLFTLIYNHKKNILIPFSILLFFTLGSLKNLEESDIESPRDPFVSLKVRFSSDINPQERRDHFLALEKYLENEQKKHSFKFILSEFNPMFLNGSFSIFPFQGTDDLELDRLQNFVDKVTREYETPPGMVLGDVFNFSIDPRPKFNLKFIAPDSKALDELVFELKESLGQLDFIDQIKTDAEETDSHSAFFKLHHDKLIKNKISSSRISSLISLGDRHYGEIPFKLENRETMLKVMTIKDFEHWSFNLWNQQKIEINDKQFLSLADLGQWDIKPQLNSLRRENGSIFGRLHFYLAEGDLGRKDEIQKKLINFLSQYKFQDGQGVAKDTSLINIEKARRNSVFIISLSIFLIFILLASMFESIRIPLSIMISVPIAVIFGLLGLKFFNLPVDPMARLGLIILTGIAVNNSIILVDVFNEFRAKGFTRSEAIIKGCSQRFISVLMSTACNVAGVLPVALGQGKIMGIPYSSMGIVIITGLIGSTIVTLILLPAFYEFFEDFGQRQGTAEVSGARSWPM